MTDPFSGLQDEITNLKKFLNDPPTRKALRKACEKFLIEYYGYTLKHIGRSVRGKGWMDEVSVLFFEWIV